MLKIGLLDSSRFCQQCLLSKRTQAPVWMWQKICHAFEAQALLICWQAYTDNFNKGWKNESRMRVRKETSSASVQVKENGYGFHAKLARETMTTTMTKLLRAYAKKKNKDKKIVSSVSQKNLAWWDNSGPSDFLPHAHQSSKYQPDWTPNVQRLKNEERPSSYPSKKTKTLL